MVPRQPIRMAVRSLSKELSNVIEISCVNILLRKVAQRSLYPSIAGQQRVVSQAIDVTYFQRYEWRMVINDTPNVVFLWQPQCYLHS